MLGERSLTYKHLHLIFSNFLGLFLWGIDWGTEEKEGESIYILDTCSGTGSGTF